MSDCKYCGGNCGKPSGVWKTIKSASLAIFPGMATTPNADVKCEKQSSVEEMRSVIKHCRRELAFKMWDFFDSIDKLDEKEFMEVITELDGDGVKISQMIEKFRKYKGL